MSYLVLARKWRPQKFEDVVNQKHVVLTLQNALKTNRLANAYLFAGPRGIGKTTIARILAKAINCEQGPKENPCNQCDSCNDITDGRSLDVLEIDGASNRGIDEVRNLRESLKYAPNPGKYKIYIIDEVHMLTTEAFNALLKTLEEPPSRVMFMFATTEPHKVPATIISRCQRFDFKRISINEIIEQLKHVCSQEQIDIDDDSLHLIARKAEGSMRDSQSLLDQAISFCGTKIVSSDIINILGVIDWEIYFGLTNFISNNDLKGAFQLVEDLFNNGHDLVEFLLGVNEHLRNILITKTVKSADFVEASDNYKQKYHQIVNNFEEQDLLRLIQIVSDSQYGIKRSSNPRLYLEMVVTKMIQLDKVQRIDALIQSLDSLKEKFSQNSMNVPHSAFQQKSQTKTPAAPVSESADQKKSPEIEKNVVRDIQQQPDQKVIAPSASYHEDSQKAHPPISIEIIKTQWPHIIEEIKKRKIALGSFLNEGWPENIDGNELVIAFGMENGFHISSINRNRKSIEEIIREVVGVPLQIKCMQAEAPSANNSNGSNGSSYVEKLGQKIPLIKTIIDEFDGELVK
ncbi:DNA polymerase III subunit gamma/tau [candidate division KSB1 bacterium]|nr:DNA polymerase III subunit gamma/tau [candidate division KSB1 bacterium]